MCGAKGPLITSNDGTAVDEAARQCYLRCHRALEPSPLSGPDPKARVIRWNC
ncbi:hypothetical protein QE373_001331 [Stenotrophomonas sp. SORGH_AS321]|nr:hypothetical protein [Stenotrophomonas sp. SORGH_AS_0321]